MLKTYQEQVLRVCFDAEANPNDLKALGNEERWLVYRRMVRDRLRRVVSNAFPRTVSEIGEASYFQHFDAWLAATPPSNRYYRGVPEEFATHLRSAWQQTAPPAAWMPDLLTLELTRWTRRYALPETSPASTELTFEAPPLCNPTAQLLRLEHAVQEKPGEGESFSRQPTYICVYRNLPDDQIRSQVLNPVAASMCKLWLEGEMTLTQSVEAACRDAGVGITESFIERLGEMLASFIERGLLLGSRPQ